MKTLRLLTPLWVESARHARKASYTPRSSVFILLVTITSGALAIGAVFYFLK